MKSSLDGTFEEERTSLTGKHTLEKDAVAMANAINILLTDKEEWEVASGQRKNLSAITSALISIEKTGSLFLTFWIMIIQYKL